MALVNTTLSAAVAQGDREINVASATSIEAGRLIKVRDEVMKVTTEYVTAATLVPVIRGQNGTAQVAHVSGTVIEHGAPTDFGVPPIGSKTQFPLVTHRRTVSYSASGAISNPNVGEDLVVFLEGTDVLAMTLTSPDHALSGQFMYIVAVGDASHTVTYTTTGFGGAGSSYDVLTANGSATCGVTLLASGGQWVLLDQVTGTLTNVAFALA